PDSEAERDDRRRLSGSGDPPVGRPAGPPDNDQPRRLSPRSQTHQAGGAGIDRSRRGVVHSIREHFYDTSRASGLLISGPGSLIMLWTMKRSRARWARRTEGRAGDGS